MLDEGSSRCCVMWDPEFKGKAPTLSVCEKDNDLQVSVEDLRALLDCDYVECGTWSISNHENGLVWMDEEGKKKGLAISASLYDKPNRIKGKLRGSDAVGFFVGRLVFSGPVDENGDCQWMNDSMAVKLLHMLRDHEPVFAMDCSYLHLEEEPDAIS